MAARVSRGPRPQRAAMRIRPFSERVAGTKPVDPFQIRREILHPAGVGAMDGMALDDAYGSFVEVNGWAYGGLNSAIAEGQVFLGYPTLAALMQRV